MLCFNSQSCRQKATDIHVLIIDNDADVLLLTETWFYPQGNEAYIDTMTTAGYYFHSFPRSGSTGGGIAFVTRTNLSEFVTFRPLDYTSFESVEMSLRVNDAFVSCICLYRPPKSKTNKLLIPHSFVNSQSCYPVMQTVVVMCPFLGTSIFISMTVLTLK